MASFPPRNAWAVVRDAIIAAITAASGLDEGRIFWSRQDGDQPKLPFIDLSLSPALNPAQDGVIATTLQPPAGPSGRGDAIQDGGAVWEYLSTPGGWTPGGTATTGQSIVVGANTWIAIDDVTMGPVLPAGLLEPSPEAGTEVPDASGSWLIAIPWEPDMEVSSTSSPPSVVASNGNAYQCTTGGETAAGPPAGKEIQLQVQGYREVTLSIEVFTETLVSSDDSRDALGIVEQIRSALTLPSIVDRLSSQGVSTIDLSAPATYVPEIVSIGFRGRAVLDVRCYVPAVAATEYTGYIAQVNGTLTAHGGAIDPETVEWTAPPPA